MAAIRVLGQLMQALRGFVPLPVLVALAIGLVVLAGPIWLENARARELRGLVRQVSRAEAPESAERLGDRALQLASARPDRLVTLGQEAHRRRLVWLRDRAWERLGEVDPARAEAERRAIQAERRTIGSPIEVTMAIEHLIAEGATEAARHRLAEARAQRPDDPELAALAERLG